MDYEKKYKELAGKIKKAYLYAQTDSTKVVLEDIFPELKESEVERIRKELLEHCINRIDGKQVCVDASDYRRWADWLFRIGEENTPNIKYDEAIRNEIIKFLELPHPQFVGKRNHEEWIAWLEKQGEKKVSVVDFNAKDWYVSKVDGKIYNSKYMEKKPTNQARRLEIEKAAMSATGIIQEEEWFIKGAEWSDKNPFCINSEKQDDNKSVKNIVETWKDMRLEVYQQASGNRHEPNYSDDTTKMFSLNDIDEIIEKMSEHKPDDKVEIKFKIEKGKWYVCIKDLLDNYANKAFYKGDTYLSTQDGSLMPSNSNIPFEVVCTDTYFRDWTIKDAKDGDVLVTIDDEHPFIYKGCLDPKHPDSPVAYCGIDDGGDFYGGGDKFNQWWTNKKVQPATKEQRDTLFKAMADDGYTFDFEKKELKKNEQPELTEFEDAVKDMMDAYRDAIGDSDATTEEVKKHAAYMLSLIPHKPAEWSEEDMSKVQRICKYLNESKKYYADITEVRECMDWLNSLKDRIGE